jgi:hypothetical protein
MVNLVSLGLILMIGQRRQIEFTARPAEAA